MVASRKSRPDKRRSRRNFKKKVMESGPKPLTNENLDSWVPRTTHGKKDKSGEIDNNAIILENGYKILEPEIIDKLVPDLKYEFLLIGQSKGKFGGGKKRIFRQVQKKTSEGNKPSFAAYAVIGNENGYVGVGYGKSRETVPAREKAIRNAKLNLIKVNRGCGSWECGCGTEHSVPFKVTGSEGSVKVTLLPAPKGAGLKVNSQVMPIFELAGIKDVWSFTRGHAKTTINVIMATFKALKVLSSVKRASKPVVLNEGVLNE